MCCIDTSLNYVFSFFTFVVLLCSPKTLHQFFSIFSTKQYQQTYRYFSVARYRVLYCAKKHHVGWFKWIR